MCLILRHIIQTVYFLDLWKKFWWTKFLLTVYFKYIKAFDNNLLPQINHEFDKENNFYDWEYSSHIAAFVPNNIVFVHSHNFIYSRHTCDSSMVVASCSNIELCIKWIIDEVAEIIEKNILRTKFLLTVYFKYNAYWTWE